MPPTVLQVVGAGVNGACAWIRYWGSLIAPVSPRTGFAVAMVGQAFGALAQPVFANSPARVSGDWFAVRERDVATTVGSLANLVGTALGAVISGIAVSGPQDIKWWLLGQAVVSLFFLAGTIAWVRDRPSSPPSASVEQRDAKRGRCPSNTSATVTTDGGAATIPTTPQPATPSAPEDGALFQLHVLDTPTGASPVARADATDARRARAAAAVRSLWLDACALLRHGNFLLLVCAYGIGVGLFGSIITLSGQISEKRSLAQVPLLFLPTALSHRPRAQLPPVDMGLTLPAMPEGSFSLLDSQARRSCARSCVTQGATRFFKKSMSSSWPGLLSSFLPLLHQAASHSCSLPLGW